MKVITVLLVDDDLGVREAVVRALEDRNYVVIQAKDGKEALDELANTLIIDIVVTDFQMMQVHGDQVAEYALNKGFPVIMMSGNIHKARTAVNFRKITDEQLEKFKLLEKGSFRFDQLDEEIKKLCV